jgi:alpha-L-fucosidase 2
LLTRSLYLYIIICTLSFIKASAQDIYEGRYNALFTFPPAMVPTAKTPDGALAGNGDIGLTFGGTPDRLVFYFGKNDFWRAYPVYPGGGIAHPGGLTITSDELRGADYYAEQMIDKAQIKGKFAKGNLEMQMNAWVAAMNNTVVIELSSNRPCRINLNLWPRQGNTSITDSGLANNVYWVTRSFENTPLLEWPCHIAMAMKIVEGSSVNMKSFTLTPGKKLVLAIMVYTNFDKKNWKQDAISEAQALTNVSIGKMRAAHANWWKQFWASSSVRINDRLLETYYYISQYLFASSSRAGKFAPGIWGPFITQDSMAWGGDYHLNYNYQAPYWASYSSNHIELTDNFDKPVLDYMEKGKQHAQSLLNIRGIYYPVGIGPNALVTTRWPLTPDEMEQRYATRDNMIDSGYKFLGQKINAVFSVGNMLMRFYSTYDSDYLSKVYPYMLECANFWEDYLKFEEGRYVIYMDHFNEIMPNLRNKGIWKDRLGDFNSTLSLGLVKMLFRGMIDVSVFLGRDIERREKWNHIVLHLSQFPTGTKDGRMSLKNMERGPQDKEVRVSGLNRVAIHGILLPAGVAGPKTDPAFNQLLWNDVDHWRDELKAPGEWGNTLNNGIETVFPGAVRVGYSADSILKYLKARLSINPLPNFYIVQGGGGIETLASVPLTINEMLLQSYEGIIRVFPNWTRSKDASFDQLRAYGAFVVSSSIKAGRVQFVKIKSERGRDCVMENPWMGRKIQLTRNAKKAEVLEGDTIKFATKENEIIQLIDIGVTVGDHNKTK